MNIQRWNTYYDSLNYDSMIKDDDGDWVLHDDIAECVDEWNRAMSLSRQCDGKADTPSAALNDAFAVLESQVRRAALAERRVKELEEERAKIVEACGFEHDNDPLAPKNLPEYVRETQELAIYSASEWTSDYREAAIRRLSRNSKHMLAENRRLRARVAELEAEKEKRQ